MNRLSFKVVETSLAALIVAGFFTRADGNQTVTPMTVSGKLNACYGNLEKNFVFLAADASNTQPSSKLFPVARDGYFKIVVPSSRFPFGTYRIEFGEGHDRRGFGSMTIELDNHTVDIGVIGDCDL